MDRIERIDEHPRTSERKTRGHGALAESGDDVAYGGVATLSNVNARLIKEIQFFSSRDATTKWGTGHMGGVILVTTKR